MSHVKDAVLMAAITVSDKLALEGRLYEAFSHMNNTIMENFTRMGFIKAILYLFEIVDECSINTRIFVRHNFIKTAYQDTNTKTQVVQNKAQIHFWAGCIKLCQYQNESHFNVIAKMESLMKAREHFRFTIQHKEKHVLALYLLTICDNTYFDLSGKTLYPNIPENSPEQYYEYALAHEPAYFLAFSYILGKLALYAHQHYLAECYLNMALCRPPKSPLEDQLSYDSLILLNQIAELKARLFY